MSSKVQGAKGQGSRGRSRAEMGRLVAAVVLSGLSVAFALLNLERVKVNWIFGTAETPLILVILVSILVGALLGFGVARASRRGDRSADRSE